MSTNNTTIFTGKCRWAKLRTPEEYNGQEIGYTMSLYLSDADLKTYTETALQALKDATTDEKFKGKKWGKNVNIGVKTDNEDVEYVRLKARASYKDKDTNEIKRLDLPVFDKFGKILPADVLIGNGSTVQVAVAFVPYHFSQQNCGVTPRMMAVKIDELIEYNANNNYGFSFEESTEETSEDEFDF